MNISLEDIFSPLNSPQYKDSLSNQLGLLSEGDLFPFWRESLNYFTEQMKRSPSETLLESFIYAASGVAKFLRNRRSQSLIAWTEALTPAFDVLSYDCCNPSKISSNVYRNFLIQCRPFIVLQLIDSQSLSVQDQQILKTIALKYSACQSWTIGIHDDVDYDKYQLVRDVIRQIKPGSALTLTEISTLYALLLYREPIRISKHFQLDETFKKYLAHYTKNLPNQPQSKDAAQYLCRNFSKQQLPQEYDLWALENSARIRSFKDKHKGETCYVIGNGPSLKDMDLSKLKHKHTIGMNKIFLLFDKIGFSTEYLVSANPFVVDQAAEEFAGLDIPKFIAMWGRSYMEMDRNTMFIREQNQPAFSTELLNGAKIHSTVTYMAFQLAYYLGFSKVILIGVDHNFESKGEAHKEVQLKGNDPNHFDPDYFGHGVTWQLPDLAGSEDGYKIAKQAFEADGREIVDATVGGKLTVFQKISWEESLLIP